MQIGEEEKANQMFEIVRKIIKNGDFDKHIFGNMKQEIEKDYLQEYPSRKDNYVCYQIALDNQDYVSASIYLEKVIAKSENNEFIAQNKKKLKQLKSLIAKK